MSHTRLVRCPPATLAARFAGHWPLGPSTPSDERALEEALLLSIEAGRAAWPGVHIESTDVVDYLAERADPQLDPLAGLAALRVGDLYLACGCAFELPAALAAFEATYPPRLRPLLHRLDTSLDFGEEMLQRLRLHLFVGDAPRIRSYRGRGALEGWLKVTVRRLALANRPELAVSFDLEGRVVDVSAQSAEGALLCRRYLPKLKEIVKHEVRAELDVLTAEERNLVRWHLVDGISLRQLARLRGINVSTVSRDFSRVRNRLNQRIQRAVVARTGLPLAEVHSIMNALVSRISLSLGAYLAPSGGELSLPAGVP